jgi:hypothetical protein
MDKGLLKFILINILTIGFLTCIAYYVRQRKLKKKQKQQQSLIEFINNGTTIDIKSTLIGLVFGIVFGFIDNFGLWFGIANLEKYMPGGIKMKAALGNTYSDGIGAIIGTLIAIIVKDSFHIDEETNDDNEPLWVNPIGIMLGCLIGIFIGAFFLK